MKYLLLTALVLWPWGVRAQSVTPEDLYRWANTDSLGQRTDEPYLSRADVQRMIEETVKARIDSALAQQGRWVMKVDTCYEPPPIEYTLPVTKSYPCTTWVWTRPEAKP